MAMKKVSVTLDEKVVAEIKTVIGDGEFSRFVNETLALRLQRRRLEQLERDLAEEFGPIPEEARQWARSLDWPEERDA